MVDSMTVKTTREITFDMNKYSAGEMNVVMKFIHGQAVYTLDLSQAALFAQYANRASSVGAALDAVSNLSFSSKKE